MKFSPVCASLFVVSASAFAPHHQSPVGKTALQAEPTSTRTAFLGQLAGAVVATCAFPNAASAAKYGPIGAGSPGVLDPKGAIIDEEIFKSIIVQKALTDVKDYAALVGEMKETLEANSQVNLGPVLKKELDFGKLRADMNTLNSAYDEDTQRGTDRLIRAILQDLTEVETANNQKEGIERSPRRVASMMAKLNKLQGTFDEFLSFAGV